VAFAIGLPDSSSIEALKEGFVGSSRVVALTPVSQPRTRIRMLPISSGVLRHIGILLRSVIDGRGTPEIGTDASFLSGHGVDTGCTHLVPSDRSIDPDRAVETFARRDFHREFSIDSCVAVHLTGSWCGTRSSAMEYIEQDTIIRHGGPENGYVCCCELTPSRAA